MKYTPGPWKYENDSQGFICDSSGSDVVADAWYSRDHEVQEANARLIAAAPELLEALKWYVENDDTNIGMEGNEFWEAGLERGKEAIKKATGE